MHFREAREAVGLSQKFVAYTLGVKPPNVSRWEAGTTFPTVDNLMKLARLYGVSTDYLLGIEEGKTIRLSRDERQLVVSYRKAAPEIRRAAVAVLGVQPIEEEAALPG